MQSFKLKKILLSVGNIIPSVVLIIFYYTIFAVFAIPYQLLVKNFRSANNNSNYIVNKKNLTKLEDFLKEY